MVHLEETGPLKGTPTRPIGSAAPWSPERPRSTKRGGFKRGPKLLDGRQPSLTKEDVAAMAEANRKPSGDFTD